MKLSSQQFHLADAPRLDRVLAIRKALGEGTYNVSASQLAVALLDRARGAGLGSSRDAAT